MKCSQDCKQCWRPMQGNCPTDKKPWKGYMYYRQTGSRTLHNEPQTMPEAPEEDLSEGA